jgi:hypothetical protein
MGQALEGFLTFPTIIVIVVHTDHLSNPLFWIYFGYYSALSPVMSFRFGTPNPFQLHWQILLSKNPEVKNNLAWMTNLGSK